ncbi:MAG: 2-C-methyl-D-erythritol 4-phosphate cytidylyltransferase [Candidatus Omnitrophica bacterium]|nr:2-C-methyl-D-erythritol 4-phosphate cytidylyltransferase [Candidatus Omnitrophota bacterium]MCM8768800.1 2-C-methyl-D-erythritol 4-phosphate cytidylyltransferase [Candidatus Omnitrophota bacterium]
MVGVVLVGGGKGRRLGQNIPKAIVSVNGQRLFLFSLRSFSQIPAVREIVLVLPRRWVKAGRKWTTSWKRVKKVVAGGKERHQSVWKGIQQLSSECEIVLIHDVARPLVSKELIHRVIKGTRKYGACIPALPITDTVKQVEGSRVKMTLDREKLVAVQTPQGFIRQILEKAYRLAFQRNWFGQDDAFLVEQLSVPVSIIPGEEKNIKVTHPQDLALIKLLLPGKKAKPCK